MKKVNFLEDYESYDNVDPNYSETQINFWNNNITLDVIK